VKSSLVLILSLCLLAGGIFAAQVNQAVDVASDTGALCEFHVDTYADNQYNLVKKEFLNNETVFVKTVNLDAAHQCIGSKGVKFEYFPPNTNVPLYSHSFAYVSYDNLSLSATPLLGTWTIKAYRGFFNSTSSTCYWDYRGSTTFNVTSSYRCKAEIKDPLNGTVFNQSSFVAVSGLALCIRPDAYSDHYIRILWAPGELSNPLPLASGGAWAFTTSPDNNHVYKGSYGQQEIRALIYRKCSTVEGVSCDYVAGESAPVTIAINAPPVAVPGPEQNISLGEQAHFNGNNSYDVDGNIVSYAWDFGDGQFSVGQAAIHTYLSSGEYTVTLTVTDNYGAQNSNTTTVYVDAIAEQVISVEPNMLTIRVGETTVYFATYHYANGSIENITSVANFSSDGGQFTGNAFSAGMVPGDFTITAEYGNVSGSASVTIVDVLQMLDIEPKNSNIEIGGTQYYFAELLDTGKNQTNITGQANFSCSGGTFQENLFTAGNATGTFQVVAEYSNLTAITNVTIVSSWKPVRIDIYPDNATVFANGTLEYHAVAYDESETSRDITNETVFWTNGGTFEGNALNAGDMLGAFDVTGTYFAPGGKRISDWTLIYVVNFTPVRLGIFPENISIQSGATQSYYAIAYDAQDNSMNVTVDTVFNSTGGIFNSNLFTAGNEGGTYLVNGNYLEIVDSTFVSISNTSNQTEPPTNPPSGGGNSGGSSYGFSGSTATPPPTAPSCQNLGGACAVTSDCCSGSCISEVCKIPEEKPPAQARTVQIIAPEQAEVGDNVKVLLRYIDSGESVVDTKINVVTPSYEIIPIITDKTGAAYYTPNEQGWYDYLVTGFETKGTASTYAQGDKGNYGQVIIRRLGNNDVQVSASPATGFFLFSLAPEIVGLLVLVLLLLTYGAYLYYKENQEPIIEIDVEPLVPLKTVRKRKLKPKEKPEEPSMSEIIDRGGAT
jgi:PKD repeat protein